MSHVDDHDALLAAGAAAVVEKPDFPALEVVLGDLAHGGSLRQDLRRPVARCAAGVRRGQDRVSLSPDGVPLLLAVAAHAEAPNALFERVQHLWAREVDRGTPVGVYGHVREGMPAGTMLDHVVEAVLFDEPTTEDPLRMI